MPILDLHPLVGSSKGSSVGNGAAGTGTLQLLAQQGQHISHCSRTRCELQRRSKRLRTAKTRARILLQLVLSCSRAWQKGSLKYMVSTVHT